MYLFECARLSGVWFFKWTGCYLCGEQCWQPIILVIELWLVIFHIVDVVIVSADLLCILLKFTRRKIL